MKHTILLIVCMIGIGLPAIAMASNKGNAKITLGHTNKRGEHVYLYALKSKGKLKRALAVVAKDKKSAQAILSKATGQPPKAFTQLKTAKVQGLGKGKLSLKTRQVRLISYGPLSCDVDIRIDRTVQCAKVSGALKNRDIRAKAGLK